MSVRRGVGLTGAALAYFHKRQALLMVYGYTKRRGGTSDILS
jgi:hypothetical protein